MLSSEQKAFHSAGAAGVERDVEVKIEMDVVGMSRS